MRDFKIGYASTAMPIRYMVERGQWSNAVAVAPPTEAPPHVDRKSQSGLEVWDSRGVVVQLRRAHGNR